VEAVKPYGDIPFPLPEWGSFPSLFYADLKWPAEKLDAIVALGESGKQEGVALTGSGGKMPTRRSTISWLKANDPQAAQLFIDLANEVLPVNAEHWQFDLWGYRDPLQYTVYHAGDEFGWHTDTGAGLHSRKLTVSLQLSDPSEYEGCDLQLRVGEEIQEAPRERGTISIFPSFVLHRVTPLTKGVRRALIGWIAGPQFR